MEHTHIFAYHALNFFWWTNFSSFIISLLCRGLPLTFFRVGLMTTRSLVSRNPSCLSETKWWPTNTTSKYSNGCRPQSRARTERVTRLQQRGRRVKGTATYHGEKMGVGSLKGRWERPTVWGCHLWQAWWGRRGNKAQGIKRQSRGQRESTQKHTHNCPVGGSAAQSNGFSPIQCQSAPLFKF